MSRLFDYRIEIAVVFRSSRKGLYMNHTNNWTLFRAKHSLEILHDALTGRHLMAIWNCRNEFQFNLLVTNTCSEYTGDTFRKCSCLLWQFESFICLQVIAWTVPWTLQRDMPRTNWTRTWINNVKEDFGQPGASKNYRRNARVWWDHHRSIFHLQLMWFALGDDSSIGNRSFQWSTNNRWQILEIHLILEASACGISFFALINLKKRLTTLGHIKWIDKYENDILFKFVLRKCILVVQVTRQTIESKWNYTLDFLHKKFELLRLWLVKHNCFNWHSAWNSIYLFKKKTIQGSLQMLDDIQLMIKMNSIIN